MFKQTPEFTLLMIVGGLLIFILLVFLLIKVYKICTFCQKRCKEHAEAIKIEEHDFKFSNDMKRPEIKRSKLPVPLYSEAEDDL